MDSSSPTPLGIVTSGEPPKLPPSKKRLALVASVVLILVIAVVGIALLGSDESNKPVTSTSNVEAAAEVEILNNSFNPATLKIKAGSKVTWTNQEDLEHWVAANPFPTHSDLPGLNAGKKMQKGETYSYTFDTPGTYHYHDDLSPTTNGTIIVE